MLDLSAGRCSNGTQYVITRRSTIINSVYRIKCIFLQPGDIVVPNEFETVSMWQAGEYSIDSDK
jgi:hypothetical protein